MFVPFVSTRLDTAEIAPLMVSLIVLTTTATLWGQTSASERFKTSVGAPTVDSVQAEQVYKQDRTALERKTWRKATAAFKGVQNLGPRYEDISNVHEEANVGLNQQVAIRKKLTDLQKGAQATEIDSLYDKGLFSLQNGDWMEAVLAFEKVRLLDEDYKDVRNKLADANFHRNKNYSPVSPHETFQRANAMFLVGAAVSAIFLPILGILLISPATRARLYLFQGKHEKAALMYEKLLLKRPGKIKYYPLLANIYLLENRRDEAALQVFKTILKLNIYTEKKQEINTIMANHYLTQGTTDASAIQTLERELHTRIKTLRSG